VLMFLKMQTEMKHIPDIKFFEEGAKDTETMALFGQYTYDELDQALSQC